jgi:hypothetical protein
MARGYSKIACLHRSRTHSGAVMVRSNPLPPLLPQLTLEDREGGSRKPRRGSRTRPPMPLPKLPEPVHSDVIFGMIRLDLGGRIMSRGMLASLEWAPGDRVSFAIREGLIVISRDPDGIRPVCEPSFLLLPKHVRLACRMQAGDRILLAALPGKQLLIVHPPAALVAMTAAIYESVAGGEGK